MVKESKTDDPMISRIRSNPPHPDIDFDLLRSKWLILVVKILNPGEILCTEPVIDDIHGSPKHKRWTCKISFTTTRVICH